MIMRILFFVFALIGFSSPSLAQETCGLSEMINTTPAPPLLVDNYSGTLTLLNSDPQQSDIVLIGDSQFQGWNPALKDAFPGKSVFNFSIGGDRTQQVLWRMENFRLDKIQPSAVVLFIGTNNIVDRGVKACGINAGIAKITDNVQRLWPKIPVFVMTIPPQGADFKAYDEVRVAVNAQIAAMSNENKNVFPVVLDDNEITCGQYGRPSLPPNTAACSPELIYSCSNYKSDNLHLTEAGMMILRKKMSESSIKFLGKDVFKP